MVLDSGAPMDMRSQLADEGKPTLVRPVRPNGAGQLLLLVEADPGTARLLRVHLHGAGWEVTIAPSAAEAVAAAGTQSFDLVICDAQLPDGDGIDLCRRLRQRQDGARASFIVLTARPSLEDKLRALELGIEDFLGKPVYASELLARAQVLLRRALRERLESPLGAAAAITGRLSDLGIADLLQAMEIGRRSGIIHVGSRDWRSAAIIFRDGRAVIAGAGRLRGREALYRLLSWPDGFFEVELKTVRGGDAVGLSRSALLEEGMRRLEEWTDLLARLPPLDTGFLVSFRPLVKRVGELPDEAADLIRLVDG